MTFRHRLAGGWVVVALLALTGEPRAGEPAREAALLARLSQIENAFRGGDARALRRAVPSGGKLRLDLKGAPVPQGSLGASQVEVVFRELFATARTASFAFDHDSVRFSPPETAFARARWERRATDGAETTDTLTFTLRAEEDDWRIEEIRSTR
jgi:hypothetical protein